VSERGVKCPKEGRKWPATGKLRVGGNKLQTSGLSCRGGLEKEKRSSGEFSCKKAGTQGLHATKEKTKPTT